MARGPRSRSQKLSSEPAGSPEDVAAAKPPKPRKERPHCNVLDGRQWIRNSISVWGDLRKSAEELRLKHPASFPVQLVERLIETFLPAGSHRVLDPFAGTGSTLVAARNLGKTGIGLELSPSYCEIATARLQEAAAATPENETAWELHQASAVRIAEIVAPDSNDLCITSPPYWNILTEHRTADRKAVRHYGKRELDLGTIADYDEFLNALQGIFAKVLTTLKPGSHCCVVVMDLRKKNRFYPFHSDLAAKLVEAGFLLDDLIIWNRQAEYNNLRPLGYPTVFRINKVHEYVLLMQKPR